MLRLLKYLTIKIAVYPTASVSKNVSISQRFYTFLFLCSLSQCILCAAISKYILIIELFVYLCIFVSTAHVSIDTSG